MRAAASLGFHVESRVVDHILILPNRRYCKKVTGRVRSPGRGGDGDRLLARDRRGYRCSHVGLLVLLLEFAGNSEDCR